MNNYNQKILIDKIKTITGKSQYYKDYCWDNWNSVPVLDKGTVLNNYDKFIVHCENDKQIINRTSGSSGIMLSIPWSLRDSLFAMKQLWERRSNFGISLQDQYITCHANYWVNNELIDNKIIVNKNCHSISKLYLSSDDIMQYIKYINDVKPTWMLLQPSVAYAIGMVLYENNIHLTSLKLIELTGEHFTPEIYDSIKRLYGDINIANNYGMQEFFGIAYGTSPDFDLEIMCNSVCVEIMNDDNQQLPDGNEGNIVVSGLINSAFPLIRYITGDRGYITHKNNKQLLHITESKSNDIFVFDNYKYDAAIFFNLIEYLNSKGFNILQFQFVYENDLLKAYLYSESYTSECTISTLMHQYLNSKYNIKIDDISVIWQKQFYKPVENNKYKYFINKTIT